MQRSRKALLQRRALGNSTLSSKILNGYSLSLFIVIWAVAFLHNLWISYGDVFSGELFC